MKKLLSVTLLAMIIFGGTAQTFGGNIRGKVINKNNNAVANIRVELCQWNETLKRYIPVSFAITNNEGIYLFVNIRAGLRVVVQVNGRLYPAQPLTITDNAAQQTGKTPYQDIPPITV